MTMLATTTICSEGHRCEVDSHALLVRPFRARGSFVAITINARPADELAGKGAPSSSRRCW